MSRNAIRSATAIVVFSIAPVLTGVVTHEQAPAARAQPAQTTTWYFYKVKWGFQNEFLDLFQKNHYPVLKARMDAGYYSAVRTYQPRYHGDGRADWTFAVELVTAAAPVAQSVREGAPDTPSEEEVIRKLYPDQVKFRSEENRRFELLEAHWDVPLVPIDFASRKR